MCEIDEKLIKEIIDKYIAKRDKEEKGTDLYYEYWRIADGLKELLRLRTENKTLNEQREAAVANLLRLRTENKTLNEQREAAVANARNARENTQRVIDASNERLTRAHGILEGVKGMLQAQDGATHRQRDFYANAIVKMIDNTKHGIQPVKFDEDDLPF